MRKFFRSRRFSRRGKTPLALIIPTHDGGQGMHMRPLPSLPRNALVTWSRGDCVEEAFNDVCVEETFSDYEPMDSSARHHNSELPMSGDSIYASVIDEALTGRSHLKSLQRNCAEPDSLKGRGDLNTADHFFPFENSRAEDGFPSSSHVRSVTGRYTTERNWCSPGRCDAINDAPKLGGSLPLLIPCQPGRVAGLWPESVNCSATSLPTNTSFSPAGACFGFSSSAGSSSAIPRNIRLEPGQTEECDRFGITLFHPEGVHPQSSDSASRWISDSRSPAKKENCEHTRRESGEHGRDLCARRGSVASVVSDSCAVCTSRGQQHLAPGHVKYAPAWDRKRFNIREHPFPCSWSYPDIHRSSGKGTDSTSDLHDINDLQSSSFWGSDDYKDCAPYEEYETEVEKLNRNSCAMSPSICTAASESSVDLNTGLFGRSWKIRKWAWFRRLNNISNRTALAICAVFAVLVVIALIFVVINQVKSRRQ